MVPVPIEESVAPEKGSNNNKVKSEIVAMLVPIIGILIVLALMWAMIVRGDDSPPAQPEVEHAG